MHFLVTGATGFIGRAVVAAAMARGHAVTALVRDAGNARTVLPEGTQVCVCADYRTSALPATYDGIIHLLWEGIGKYGDAENFLANVEPQFRFLKRMIDGGLRNVTVAGTCFEYGLQEGKLSEDTTPARPCNYYGLGKLTLYRMLELLRADHADLAIKWLRYFYVYGPGQKRKTLLTLLLDAVARGDADFPMSPGDQERDFIHVETLAHNTVVAAEQGAHLGPLNIGNGKPQRVLDFVEEILKIKGANTRPAPGRHDYAPFEPFSFYADTAKLGLLEGARFDEKIRL